MKKKFSIFTILLLCIALLSAAVACGGDETGSGDEGPSETVRTLRSITLDTTNVQKVFAVDSEFTYEGLIVTANYDAAPLIETVTDYTVEEPDLSTVGVKTVTVSYQDKTAEYTVNVNERGLVEPERTLQSITLNTDGVQKEFTVGDAFTYEGLIVTANYNLEPLTEEVTGFTVKGPDMDTAGSEKAVIVSYQGKTASYTITVSEPPAERAMKSISVDVKNAKTSFTVGDEFTYEGIVVTAHYNVAPLTEEVKDYEVNADEIDTSVVGTQTVMVTYMGFYAGYEIEVLPVMPDSITVDASEAKTEYFTGDTFSAEGIVVTAHYGEEEQTLSAADYLISAPDMSKAGEQDVTVTYYELSTSYQITVTEPAITSIEVNAEGAPHAFAVGGTFSYEGIIVTAIYNSGKREVLSADSYTVTPPDMNVANESAVVKVTLNGSEISETYTVSIRQPTLESITLDTQNVTKAFKVNAQLECEGLIVTAHYNIGEDRVLDETEYTVTEPDMTSEGSKEVTVTVKDSEIFATYSIEVVALEVRSIKAVTDNATLSFFTGDKFTYEGLKVEVTYEDNSVKTVENGFTVTGPTEDEMALEGEKTVTVSYLGKECTYMVQVSSRPDGPTDYAGGKKIFAAGLAALEGGCDNQGDFIGNLNDGASFIFTINVAAAGEYELLLSAAGQANDWGGTIENALQLTLDGSGEPTNINIGTNGWTNFTEIRIGKVTLTKGNHTFKFAATANTLGHANVHYFAIAEEGIYTGVEQKYGVSGAKVDNAELQDNAAGYDGHIIGNVAAGTGTVTFTVNAKEAGSAALYIGAAGGTDPQEWNSWNPTAPQTEAFEVFVNGTSVGKCDVGTGNWTNFTDIAAGTITLNAGSNTITIKAVNGNFNIGYIKLAPPKELPKFEGTELTLGAAVAELAGGCDYQAGNDIVGNIASSAVITFKFNAAAAANVKFILTLDGPNAKKVSLTVNGTSLTEVEIPASDGWLNFAEAEVGTATLNVGENVIEIRTSTGGFNLRSLRIVPNA